MINMLQNKGTKKIQELENDFTPGRVVSEESILDGFKALKPTESLSEFKYFKKRGYSFQVIVSALLSVVLSAENTVHGYFSGVFGRNIEIGKDVFYRLKNNENICWRVILWHLATRFLCLTGKEESNEGKPRYLIFDDTVIEKTGKRIEFIGRTWDHVKQRSILGFKLLVMMYWDGISSIPLDFSIHREKGQKEEKPFGMSKKELKRRYSRKRMKESCSQKRVEELDKSKIEMVLKMFFLAVYRGIKIDYVLVDSWFTCDALIQAILSIKEQSIHLIGMYKFAKTKFSYQGEELTHGQIMNKLGNPKRCRKLGYHYKYADVLYQGLTIRLFFSRRSKRDKWKVILTTDTRLSFIQVIEHYQIRWTVEVFFRESKQLLHLGKCQSNNFDAQIADATLSMIAYILLSFRYRCEHYESLGTLFREINEERLSNTLDRRIWGLFVELATTIAEVFEIDVDELLEKLFSKPEVEEMLVLMFANRSKMAG